jgi:hypothetical protein
MIITRIRGGCWELLRWHYSWLNGVIYHRMSVAICRRRLAMELGLEKELVAIYKKFDV